MKRCITTLFALAYFILSYCQSSGFNKNLGYLIDNKGQRIFDYADFDYEPENPIDVDREIKWTFSPGVIYDNNKNPNKGYFKIDGTSICYRKNPKDATRYIKPADCVSFVICKDSFIFVTNPGSFKYADQIPVEIVEKLDGITFYKLESLNGTEFLYKPDSSASLSFIPSGPGKFKDAAPLFSGNSKFIEDKVKTGKLSFSNLPSIIKILKYEQHFKKSKKIYFNAYWDEISDSVNATYYGQVVSINDSSFHMKYNLINDIPLYEGDFTSFYPHLKHGTFTWYHPNGEIRKINDYKNNKLIRARVFHNNHQLHYDYKLKYEDFFYNQIFDQEGKPLLDEDGKGTEEYFDSVNNRKITFVYKEHLLKEAFYYDTLNRMIYLTTYFNAAPFGVKIKKDEYPEKSVSDFIHGNVLVKCLIGPSGYLMDYKIIKGLSKEIDDLVSITFNKARSEKQFRPAVNNNRFLFEEIVIPVSFNLEGFSHYRNNYYNFSRDIMLQQQMMHRRTVEMNQIKTNMRSSLY